MGELFENWSGSVRCEAREIARPDSIEAVQRLVRNAASKGLKVRAIGSGHSFTPLVETNDIILSLDNLQGVESVNADKTEAVVWAGTKLWRLSDLLWDHGVAMENLGDINKQSLAGAVSTGTHGTGAAYGVIANQLRGVTLVTASGDVMEISATENPELLKAAQVSLGSLGIIVKARLAVVPAYNMRYIRKRSTLDETAARFDEYKNSTRHFEFYWFPYTEDVQLKFLNETKEPARPRTVQKFLNDVILENATFGALCKTARAFPSFCEMACKICGKFLSEGDETNRSYRVLSTTRLVRFNEIEYGVPSEAGIATLREIKNWIAKKKIQVNFPIEFRVVKGDDIWMSPANGRETVFISLHMYKGMPWREYFEGAEEIFRAHGGRPHWGKMHSMKAEQLAPLYPNWEDFQDARQKLDPRGVFVSPYLERVLGPVGVAVK